mmetsp:Transcript_1685/g.2634  ORF Transcript_1685/g.2634 Transcript_1685/m.2634 type:complete len:111 (-) Transcript_1685:218-550(-)
MAHATRCTRSMESKGWYWDRDATCTTQAFFGQAVVGTVTYNAVLAGQYFMIVNLKMSERTIAKKYEKVMHILPFLMWIVTAIIGISFDALDSGILQLLDYTRPNQLCGRR